MTITLRPWARWLALPAAILAAYLLPAPAGAADEEAAKDKPAAQKATDDKAADEKAASENAPAGEAAQAADPNSAPAKPARVFTNKDLERYRGKTGRAVVRVDLNALAAAKEAREKEDAGGPQPLYPDEKDRLIAEKTAEIEAAQARITALDERLRSVLNPFLPRPDVSEEEREEEKGLGGKALTEKLQAERAELEGKIAGLRAEIDAVVAAPTKARPNAPPPPPTAPPS